ncbi:hypothetical protein PAMP_012734 [Pampus punctatissimus]
MPSPPHCPAESREGEKEGKCRGKRDAAFKTYGNNDLNIMAETYSKTKLKRMKPCVAENQQDISHRETLKNAEFPAGTEGSVGPAAVWWNREQLPAVETLYALMLKSAVSHLENQHWDLVPDLPHPSTVKPTLQRLYEQQWCDLSEEVDPFPQPTSPKCQLRPDQQTRSVTDISDTLLSSHSQQRHDGKMVPTQALKKRCWQGESSSAGCSSVREEGRKAEEHEKVEKVKRETGAVNRHTNQVTVFDRRAPLQEEGENNKAVTEDKEEEDVQGSGRRDGGVAGGELQSCPMCLLVFPAGFTQMDCDGHLAQCLSEMNVDMTW